MKYKTTKIFLFSTLLLILFYNSLFSQVVADTFYVPNYPIPEIYYTDEAPELPDNVWNHKLKYFPDSIVEQLGSTCGQTSGIFNCLTYMFNRAYDREADSSNIFPPNYTYNQINQYHGVSTFDSWNLVKSQGHPSQLEYETINFYASMLNPDANADHFRNFWMQGYNNYYKSFFNRITNYHSLDVKTDEDLKILQYFLFNMFESNKDGGIAIFYTNPFSISDRFCTTMFPELYPNYPCAVIDTIYEYYRPTHSMTLTGYFHNDSVDFNGDGIISDTIDINGDGKVDFHDNEKIFWIVYDSKGQRPPYLLKYDVLELFWNQQVFFPIPDTTYSPELTFKIKFKHPERGDIKITAGISSDLESEKPEIEIDLPVFNFQGRDICFTGVDSLSEPDILEFGIDITDLKNYIPESDVYKVFLLIENEGTSSGELQKFSIMDYSHEEIIEYDIINTPVIIHSASNNYFSDEIYLESKSFNNHIQIEKLNRFAIPVAQSVEVPIIANFGSTPYEYTIINDNEYIIELSNKPFPSDENYHYDTLFTTFVTPDWNFSFSEMLWNSIKVTSTGAIYFDTDNLSFVELYPYQTAPKISQFYFKPFELDYPRGGQLPLSINITNDYLEIFTKIRYTMAYQTYLFKNESYTKITKDGVIETTYGDTISRYYIFPHIKTEYNKYLIPNIAEIPDTFNTVTFTPNPADSLFTIDENGVLTMQAVSEPGKYETYVLVRDADGQEFTKRIEVNVINENIIGKLYPNPTKDILFCDIYNPTEQNTTIEIFAITGQCVYKETTLLAAGITEHNFNTAQFGQGVYLLKISMGGNSQTQRFVVTK